MTVHRVTELVDRDELRRLARRDQDDGDLAESIVVEAFGLEPVADGELEGDAVNPRTGARYEVKSTRPSVGDRGAEGRFRLWEDQHRSVVSYDARDDLTGWYVFVLFDGTGTPTRLRRVEPSTVTQLVDAAWNAAGHDERDARQHKLPYTEVFPDA